MKMRSATHCKTLQHTATRCNTPPPTAQCLRKNALCCNVCTQDRTRWSIGTCRTLQRTATHCNALQRTATHCNTRTVTHCNALQRTATHCNALQRTTPHCNTMRHSATYCNILQHAAQCPPENALFFKVCTRDGRRWFSKSLCANCPNFPQPHVHT